jgi:hypothetical protein
LLAWPDYRTATSAWQYHLWSFFREFNRLNADRQAVTNARHRTMIEQAEAN